MTTAVQTIATEDAEFERLRSGQACMGCRKRKNKCDGMHPECGFCKKRKLNCEYPPQARLASGNDRYVVALEKRVRQLEREQRRFDTLVTADSPATPPSTNDAAAVKIGTWPAVAEQTSVSSISNGPFDDLAYSSDGEVHLQPESLDVLDYEDTSIHTVLADFGQTPCFGSRKRRRTTSESRPDMRKRSARTGGVIRGQNELKTDNFARPPRGLAGKLVDAFFEHVFPLYPFVHEPTFRRQFAASYDTQQQMSIPWQSSLNLIFAFGCDYLDLPLTQIYTMSQEYHRRGAELILSVCFDTSTVEVVQALLLLSGHLQSNMQFNRLWASMGCIVRTAQGLGFHVDPGNWQMSAIEKELRRRLWWGIYEMDHFISLKHGRPPAVLAEANPVLPATPTHDQCITDAGITEGQADPAKGPPAIHFFNAVVQLAYITETILVSSLKDTPWCHSARTGDGSDNGDLDPIQFNIQIGLAVEQEGKLSVWTKTLPEHLQFDNPPTNPRSRSRQQMLRVRYLHTRLMIHRQNLLSVIQRDRTKTMEPIDKFLETTLMASVRQCVECACDIVGAVKDGAQSKHMGPWWQNVQFIYTALGVLFGVQSRASIANSIDEDATNSAMNSAMEYLHQLGDVSATATKCRKYFDSLRTWSENKRSPLDVAILRNLQIPASLQTRPEPQLSADNIGQTQTQNGIQQWDNSMDSHFGDLDYGFGSLDGASHLFFSQPLLPDLDFDFLDAV